MSFEDILNEWEKKSARPGGLEGADRAEREARAADAARLKGIAAARERERREASAPARSLEAWLDRHGVDDKDAAGRGGEESRDRGEEGRRLRELRPRARIDLHGMTAEEAASALDAFLEREGRRGVEKVLIVTGKGNHSKGEPVLGRIARRVLESSPWAGRFGVADAVDGGRGALWALLRKGPISRGR